MGTELHKRSTIPLRLGKPSSHYSFNLPYKNTRNVAQNLRLGYPFRCECHRCCGAFSGGQSTCASGPVQDRRSPRGLRATRNQPIRVNPQRCHPTRQRRVPVRRGLRCVLLGPRPSRYRHFVRPDEAPIRQNRYRDVDFEWVHWPGSLGRRRHHQHQLLRRGEYDLCWYLIPCYEEQRALGFLQATGQ